MSRLDSRDLIDELVSIITYAAVGYHFNHKDDKRESRKATERALTMIRLWDRLDQLDRQTIDCILVELDGLIMQKSKARLKELRTMIGEYIEL